MIETEFFAFYGSLRRGMVNYAAYQPSIEYLETTRINGFELYALEEYPYAVRSENNGSYIVAEIFRIKNTSIREEINQMELDAGYVLELIEIEGSEVGIYLFEKKVNNKRVIGGDWVQFFGVSNKL